MNKNILIWDLETSGLTTESVILEIGAITVIDGVVKKYEWMLNHDVEISVRATEINGITKEMVDKDGLDPEQVHVEFRELLKSCDIHITHNGLAFDIPFIVKEMTRIWKYTPEQRLKLSDLLRSKAYDTAVAVKARKLRMVQRNTPYLDFARSVMGQRIKGLKYNLALACEELQIDTTDMQAHRALGDVEMTYQVYLKQIL